jgi:hypothetical protein
MKLAYKVIQPFEATAPISGTQRRFNRGEIVVCDTKQSGEMLTIELGTEFATLFLVDRAVFKDCCEWYSKGPGGI